MNKCIEINQALFVYERKYHQNKSNRNDRGSIPHPLKILNYQSKQLSDEPRYPPSALSIVLRRTAMFCHQCRAT